MSYLETLIELEKSVTTSEFSINHKMIMIGLIGKEQKIENIKINPIKYFYEDVTSKSYSFDFASVLSLEASQLANDEIISCTNVFPVFSGIESSSSLLNWLQSAIKFTDQLSLHYLQEILKEAPTKQGDYGKERSRYVQINKKIYDAEKAGRIMDNLYDERNKLEHRTVNDSTNPGFQKIIPPKYHQARKKILKKYPEVLICFNDCFVRYYK
jgi:hypothetical protein